MTAHAPPRFGAFQRGLGMIWVALCCGLAFASVLTALFYWTDWQDTDMELKRQQNLGKEIKARYEVQANELDKILPYTSLKRVGEGDPPTAEAQKYLQDRQAEYLPAYLKLRNVDRQLSLATLQDCAEVAGMSLDIAIAGRDRAKAERERRKTAVEIAKKRAPVIEEVRQRNAELIQKETQALVEERNKVEADFTPEAGKIEEQTKKETEETAKIAEDQKKDMLRLENEINELKRRLEEVKQREVIRYDITEVHGEITEYDIEGKFAFISIGSDQRVVKGLRFHCALPGEFGQLVYKGEVEVKRVWPSRSQVAITAVYDPFRPILKGDVLVNPLFGTKRPKVVAFAGEPSSRKIRFSVNEATRRIMEIQSVVKPETAVDIDFLITTEAYEGDKNYIKAVELQIPIAGANDVLKYLGD